MLTATKKASRANIPFVAAGLGVVALWGLSLWAGPKIEQAYFPVVSGIEIDPVGGAEPGSSRFVLSGNVHRQCQFVYMTMGPVEDGEAGLAPVEYHIIVPPGPDWAMFVDIAAGEAKQIAGQMTFHCPWTPWISRVPVVAEGGKGFANNSAPYPETFPQTTPTLTAK